MRPRGSLLALAVLLIACGVKQSEHAPSPSPPRAVAPAAGAASALASVATSSSVAPVAAGGGRTAQLAALLKGQARTQAPPARPAARAALSSQAEPAAGVASASPAPLTAGATPVAGVTPPARATPADPAILSASARPNVVHDGDTVTWDVRTTRDVVAVEAKVNVASFALQRDRPGHFGLAFHVPAGVPPLFHGTYAVELTARTSSGLSAMRTVELRFQ